MHAGRAPRQGALIFGATIFCGAFLVFGVQPVLGAFVLPWFGGSPAVWTACMLFFQVMLLMGYAYAHWVAERRSAGVQGGVHLALLLASLAFLPITPDSAWQPTDSTLPVARILGLLVATVGLPYLVLSATSPLIQAWAGRVAAGSPYRLYAWSNVGSLLALLSYPVLVDPWLGAADQTRLWSLLYVGFVVLSLASLWTWRQAGARAANGVGPAETGPPPLRGDRALWVALPAAGSVMLLAVTDAITQDVSVVPLFWVAPLALYLLTFIICFALERPVRRGAMAMGIVLAMSGMLALMLDVRVPLSTHVGVWCGALFLCCLALHAELVRLKPSRRQLTSFYLAMSLGGALGGLLVGLVAPLVFNGHQELHFGILSTIILLGVVAWRDPTSPMHRGGRPGAWLLVATATLALAGGLGYDLVGEARGTVERHRSFFGVLRVVEQGDALVLMDGRISHGYEMRGDGEPTGYYARNSAVGRLLSESSGPRRVGLVGLGVGTLAAYGRPGDVYRFYELNPDVVDVARRRFTFLRESAAAIEIVPGDARLSLAREPDAGFDVLVLDAFSGDAVPTHLLTVEALQLYLRHLAPHGVVAFHVSNKHLELSLVVHRLAEAAGLASTWTLSWSPSPHGDYATRWMLLARDPATLLSLGPLREPPALDEGRRAPLWTDDHRSLWPVTRTAD